MSVWSELSDTVSAMGESTVLQAGEELLELSLRIELMRDTLYEAQKEVYQVIERLPEAYQGTAQESMMQFTENLYLQVERLSQLYASCSTFINRTDAMLHLCDSEMAGEIMYRVVKKYK